MSPRPTISYDKGLARKIALPITITAALTGYAYGDDRRHAGQTKGPENTTIEETNASLTTPFRGPTTGTLALGTPGLSILRREELVGGRQ